MKLSAPASSSGQAAAPRVSESRMTRNDNDLGTCSRSEEGRRPPIKVPLGRVVPPRVRKFIPKPLILVERMKARQLVLESPPPVASEYCVAPGTLNRQTTVMTTPLSTCVTPMTRRIPAHSTLSSDSHSSSSASVRMSLQNDVVFGSGFGMMPRSVRPFSAVTLGDSSSSTDTFVADSPCWIKRVPFNIPLLVTATDATNVDLDARSDPGKKSVYYAGIPVPVDLMAADFVYSTRQSIDTFQPAAMSTPFASSCATASSVPSSTTIYTTHLPEQMPRLPDSFEIASPTSRSVYPFNVPNGNATYIVKLPNSRSTISLSKRTNPASSSNITKSPSKLIKSSAPPATLANAPKPALDVRRLSGRATSPSPTLVLDGVFALPRASPSSPSPRRTLYGFSRPRKPMLCRPLFDISNASAIVCPSQLPPAPCGRSGSISPRSKLAHVLTTHAGPQRTARPHVPPLVKGVQASNDPRTQCEIEGLRVRRVVGLGRGDGGGGDNGDIDGDDGCGRSAIGRMSLAGVGMVAKLRARWEMGTVERCGRVDGCA